MRILFILLVASAMLACGGDRDGTDGGLDGGRTGDGSVRTDGGGVDGGTVEPPAVTLASCFEVIASGGDGVVHDVAHADGTVYAAAEFEESFTVGGITATTTTERAGILIALEATTGALTWHETYESSGQTSVVAVDALPGGDLVVAFLAAADLVLGTDTLAAGLTVARLAAGTREPVWTQTFTATDSVSVSFGKLDPEGRFVVAGRVDGQMPIDATTTLDAGGGTAGPDGYAIALDSATGEVHWAASFGESGGFDDVVAVAFADGDLLLTGSSRNDGDVDSRLYVERLDGATGDEVWRQRFVPDSGTGRRQAHGTAIAVTPDGVLVAGPFESGANVGTGSLTTEARDSAFVALYDPADGSAVRVSLLEESSLTEALVYRDGVVPLLAQSTYLSIATETLAPTAAWDFPEGLALFAQSTVEVGGRLYVGGRNGNVLGSLDPAVVCLALP
jgi:outer membrane protein assembly factor BamB